MNLTPELIDDDVYCIELLDYVTADLGNVQPQQLLNKITYIYSNHNNIVSNYQSTIEYTFDSIDSDYDDIEYDIEQVEASNDVVDIVGTYAELLQYHTDTLELNDVIKVISDETHDNACTFYRWDGTVFNFDSYERNDIPVTITSSITITPNYDVTYVVVGNGITVTVDTSNYTIGETIMFIALSQFTAIYSGITKVVYPNDTLKLYYLGNNIWTSEMPEVQNKLYPVGTILFTNTSTMSLSGVWELIDEGLLLMSDTDNVGTITGEDTHVVSGVTGTVESHVITLTEIPSHTHTVTGTSGNVSAGHTHTVASVDKPRYSSKLSGSNTADTGSSRNTNGINRNHTHTITGNSGGVSGGTASPSGHSHTITFNDITFDTRQSSIAYYAWKRVDEDFNGESDIRAIDIPLFSQENWFKEFEVSFNIESINISQPSGDKATFVACMDESGTPWTGFMLRIDGVSNKQITSGTYPVWGINTGLNRDTSNQQIKTTTPYISAIEGHKITFKRTYTDSVLKVGFYIDDVLIGENDYTNSTYYTDAKLTFGAELDGSDNARRFCKCKLSHIKVVFDGTIIYNI